MRWTVSYSDFVTLLLAFFAGLYSLEVQRSAAAPPVVEAVPEEEIARVREGRLALWHRTQREPCCAVWPARRNRGCINPFLVPWRDS